MSPPRAERAAAVAVPLLVVGIVLAYAGALTAAFQFDDWNVIVGDPRVQSLHAWWSSMPGIRPLLKLSYAVNHESGFGAAGFHAFNVALHLANALLVLALLRRWPARASELDGIAVSAESPRSGGFSVSAGAAGSTNGAPIAAVVAAILFALHPVQTEAVSYAAGRSVSLAAFFCLASLLSWVVGRERRSAWLAAVLSPLLFALALGVRETAVVLPLALLLWRATAHSPVNSAVSSAAAWRDSPVCATLGHWAVLAVAILVAVLTPGYGPFFSASLHARGLVEQALTQIDALTYLAGQLLRFDRLNADPLLPVRESLTLALAVKGLALAAVAALGVASLRRRPAIAFGLLWFFLWLAPTNSLMPRLDVANDRQLYLALLGPAWLVGLAIAKLAAARPRLTVAIVCLMTLGLGFATAARNRVYANEIVFWEDVVAKTPANARAWNNLGYALALADRNGEAEAALRRAYAIDPGNFRAGVNLRLLREGRLTATPRTVAPPP